MSDEPLPDSGKSQSRISKLQTSWALVQRAHGPDDSGALRARHELLERYAPAVRRYLRALTKNTDLAEDLYQEFAVCILQGELRRADQALGQFRKYLKTVLFNLVRQDHRLAQRRAAELEIDVADEDRNDELFRQTWRAEILSQAWSEIEAFEQSTGRPYFCLLKYRAEHPQATSTEMLEFLSSKLDATSISESAVRKTLQRAREQFAKYLTRAVRDTLANPTQQELVDELRELGLIQYCDPVL